MVERPAEEVFVWGRNEHGELSIGDTTIDKYMNDTISSPIDIFSIARPVKLGGYKVAQIALGYDRSVALNENGEVFTTGYAAYGLLGPGITSQQNSFRKVSTKALLKSKGLQIPDDHMKTKNPDNFFVQVCNGTTHSAALLKSGLLITWGGNLYEKQLNKPENLQNIIEISCGREHTVVCDGNGNVHIWGQSSCGQLGLGIEYSKVYSPTLVSFPFKVFINTICCGELHTLALSSDGALFSWGSNDFGQLGIGSQNFKENKPVHITQFFRYRRGKDTVPEHSNIQVELEKIPKVEGIQIAAGTKFTVLLSSDGSVYTCGDKSFVGRNIPSRTQTEDSLFYIFTHCFVRIPSMKVKMANSRKLQLISTEKWEMKGEDITSVGNLQSLNIQQIACGFSHAICLTVENKVLCWGNNNYGQTGNNISKSTLRPSEVIVPSQSPIIQISAGGYASLASITMFQSISGMNQQFLLLVRERKKLANKIPPKEDTISYLSMHDDYDFNQDYLPKKTTTIQNQNSSPSPLYTQPIQNILNISHSIRDIPGLTVLFIFTLHVHYLHRFIIFETLNSKNLSKLSSFFSSILKNYHPLSSSIPYQTQCDIENIKKNQRITLMSITKGEFIDECTFSIAERCWWAKNFFLQYPYQSELPSPSQITFIEMLPNTCKKI